MEREEFSETSDMNCIFVYLIVREAFIAKLNFCLNNYISQLTF